MRLTGEEGWLRLLLLLPSGVAGVLVWPGGRDRKGGGEVVRRLQMSVCTTTVCKFERVTIITPYVALYTWAGWSVPVV